MSGSRPISTMHMSLFSLITSHEHILSVVFGTLGSEQMRSRLIIVLLAFVSWIYGYGNGTFKSWRPAYESDTWTVLWISRREFLFIKNSKDIESGRLGVLKYQTVLSHKKIISSWTLGIQNLWLKRIYVKAFSFMPLSLVYTCTCTMYLAILIARRGEQIYTRQRYSASFHKWGINWCKTVHVTT